MIILSKPDHNNSNEEYTNEEFNNTNSKYLHSSYLKRLEYNVNFFKFKFNQ